MSLDPGPLGELAAKIMDRLEAEYGEDAELADAILFVEVRHRDEDGDQLSTVEGDILSGRSTVGVGIAIRALQALTDPD